MHFPSAYTGPRPLVDLSWVMVDGRIVYAVEPTCTSRHLKLLQELRKCLLFSRARVSSLQ